VLAGALFYVALIALVATTILSAGLAMTRAAGTRMAETYLAAGFQRANASLMQALSANPSATFTPLPPLCANAACTYSTNATIALTQNARPTPGPACDSAQTNCAANVQTNTYVQESRLAAAITVNVLDSDGSVIATRSGTVVLRTMTAPPHVAIAGARDTFFDDVANGNAPGDDGGAPPATPNPCATPAAGLADDTAIRVAYRNAATNACSDGSAWGDASYSASASVAGWAP
jgi:hypothetical protein